MIQIGLEFLRAFSPNEQLIMLQLLLHADKTGVVEFSDRGISRLTGIPYQQVRTIHQKWSEDRTITNAPTNAPDNAKRCFVTICDHDSYNVINIFSNAVTNAVTNALKKKEVVKETEEVSPLYPLKEDLENNQERVIISPYNPPEGDGVASVSLEEFEELKKAFDSLSEENRKLREEKENQQKKKSERPLWKESYEEYSRMFNEARDILLADSEFRAKQEGYYNNIDYEKTIDKNLDYWLREDTWERAKKERVQNINPVQRIKNNFDKNRIYKSAYSRYEEEEIEEENGEYDIFQLDGFKKMVRLYMPFISDMEMPNQQQFDDMLRICNNDIIGRIQLLQDTHHTGSLYDLFKERFGNN